MKRLFYRLSFMSRRASSLSCKSLFSSGKSSRSNSVTQSKEESAHSRIQHTVHIECEVAKVKAEIAKEQEARRIKELKELLPIIEQGSWKYQPIDEILGLATS